MNLSPQMYRVTEVLGENINTDGELSHHGVDQRLVTLVLWGMGELEIEWLQNMVKGIYWQYSKSGYNKTRLKSGTIVP